MGLDITFFKTKRNDFIDGEKNIYDNNDDNINETIIEINNSDIIEISKLIDDKLFVDKLTTPLNNGYIVYVECNY